MTVGAPGDMFGETYVRFDLPRLTVERSRSEALFLSDLLGCKAEDHILDAPCGDGRIAHHLATMGYRVTGLDSSSQFIELARARHTETQIRPTYRVGDIRAMRYSAEFDVAISWYGSFGMFSDAEDFGVLERYAEALKPGGRLLIDLHSIHRLTSAIAGGRGRAITEFHDAGDVMFDSRTFDAQTSRVHGRRLAFFANHRVETTYSQRYFTATELGDWLSRAGFGSLAFFDENGMPYTGMSSRLLVVATLR